MAHVGTPNGTISAYRTPDQAVPIALILLTYLSQTVYTIMGCSHLCILRLKPRNLVRAGIEMEKMCVTIRIQ